MALLTRFTQNIQQHNLFQKTDQLLLAVSGGIDSVVLAQLCHEAGYSFFIAHCNFHLREEESNRDEAFVRSLADKYAVPFYVKSFDTEEFAEENKISIQVAARELRYNWFRELAGLKQDKEKKEKGTTGKVKILTAHHANDNIETLLMNFFKGTGIKGLQGILPKQDELIRPLLFAMKEELVQYAGERALSFVEDSSNLLDKYTRNYLRNQWIPSVQKIFPQVEANLIHNIERFREVDVLYSQAMEVHRSKLIEQKGNEIHIPVLKLLKVTPLKTVFYEILKEYGFTAHQTDEGLKLMTSETGKYISSATHRIIKNRNWIVIAPVDHAKSGHVIIDEKDHEIHFDQGVLIMKKDRKVPQNIRNRSENEVYIDAATVEYPLLLRKWRQGDYFYPLGMTRKISGNSGKKKLSKFFIDQKISLTEKESIYVLESNQRIVWVINKRLDDRFKITPQTSRCISIEFIVSEKSH